MNSKKITPQRRKLVGTVISTAMNKTAVVRVDRVKIHKKYQKRYTVSKKFKAHDENNSSKVGERVTIEETRPVSKEKKWRIVQAPETNVK